MRLAAVGEIRRIEERCGAERGLEARVLMLNAGRAVAKALREDEPFLAAADVLVLCGPGNNGGDGFVIARELKKAGVPVRVHSLEPRAENKLRHEMKEALEAEGVVVQRGLEAVEVTSKTFVIDALYGTGLSRPLDASTTALLKRLNATGVRTVAIDGPSGLDFDRGIVASAAPVCVWTYALGLAKPGFFLNEGPRVCGRIRVLDIGFPRDIVAGEARGVFLVGAKTASRLLPSRTETGNKSRFGRALIVAGNEGVEGAGILAATAAARAGAGYVTWASRVAARSPTTKAPPDFLTAKWDGLETKFEAQNAIVFGPGVGKDARSEKLLGTLRNQPRPVVLDADGLSLFEGELPKNWILTPHAGEAAKILGGGVTAHEIEADRLKCARALAAKTGTTVVLKGFHTVVDDGERSFIINSGNVALAKAGTGDVLAGLIGGLLAQGLGGKDAAVLGTWIHGACADLWVRRGLTTRTLMASDLPALFGRVFRRLEKRRAH